MANTKKTFTIDSKIELNFKQKCQLEAFNQSQLVEMFMEAFTLKGLSLFSGIIWTPNKPAKLLSEVDKNSVEVKENE